MLTFLVRRRMILRKEIILVHITLRYQLLQNIVIYLIILFMHSIITGSWFFRSVTVVGRSNFPYVLSLMWIRLKCYKSLNLWPKPLQKFCHVICVPQSKRLTSHRTFTTVLAICEYVIRIIYVFISYWSNTT